MDIRLTGRHCEFDPRLTAYANERLQRCEKFASDIREAHLVLKQEKFRFFAEITMLLNQTELVATEESNEAYDAINMAADRIEKQLRRLHDRRTRDRRHAEPLRDVTPAPVDVPNEEG